MAEEKSKFEPGGGGTKVCKVCYQINDADAPACITCRTKFPKQFEEIQKTPEAEDVPAEDLENPQGEGKEGEKEKEETPEEKVEQARKYAQEKAEEKIKGKVSQELAEKVTQQVATTAARSAIVAFLPEIAIGCLGLIAAGAVIFFLFVIGQGLIAKFSTGGGTIGGGSNLCLQGNIQLTQNEISNIEKNKPIYQVAAEKAGIPWEMLAAVHYREANNSSNGSLISGQASGTPEPDQGGKIYHSLQETADEAARILQQKVNNQLTSDTTDSVLIKDAFFGYNDRADTYRDQAERFGFDRKTQGYEGSPYVMSGFDAARTSTMLWIHCDHCAASLPADTRLGAYVVYLLLINAKCPEVTTVIAGNTITPPTGSREQLVNHILIDLKGVITFQGPVASCGPSDIKNNLTLQMVKTLAAIGDFAKEKGIIIQLSALKCNHQPTGLHGVGRAIDIGNEEIAPILVPALNANSQVLEIDELIYGNALVGNDRNYYNLKKGLHFNYSTALLDEHKNHIHVGVLE